MHLRLVALVGYRRGVAPLILDERQPVAAVDPLKWKRDDLYLQRHSADD